jgi:hypothetical protein
MTGGLILVVYAVLSDTQRRPAAITDRSPAMPAVEVPQPAPARANLPTGARSGSQPLSDSFKTKPIVRPIAGPKLDLDGDYHENPMVNAGDYLLHPQLGLCEVLGDDDSGGTRIRVPAGKMRVLRLEALEVMPGVEDEEGRHVFNVTGPRRR